MIQWQDYRALQTRRPPLGEHGTMHKIIYAVDRDMIQRNKIKGFSLLEMLLVLAIASSLIVLMLNYTAQKSDEMRRTKTVLQMQQILNASMSYYLNNGFWPLAGASITSTGCSTTAATSTTWTDISQLQPNYIPSTLTNNSYGQPFMLACNATGGFYAYTTTDTIANAQIIAGRLPMAFITDSTGSATNPPSQSSDCAPTASPMGTGCTIVVSNVTIPGQNLNNARSVNYAGTFYSGSCVPAPNCPPGMKPDIIVAPAGASGINDGVSCTSNVAPYDPITCSGNIYPISSFTAFVRGANAPPTTSPNTSNTYPGTPLVPASPGTASGSSGPYDCEVTVAPTQQGCSKTMNDSSAGTTSFPNDGTLYWRVCLAVVTGKGIVFPGTAPNYTTQQGKMMGAIIAFTRCVPNNGNEYPAGSFDVYQTNANNNP